MRQYFDVVLVLAIKDFKVRYRNSALGFLWSLLNPLAYMAILTVVFSFLLRVSIPNYAAWVLVGLLVWRFFSIGTAQSLGSIVGNPSLVGKVYVPRYLIVISNNLANLLGASLEFIALLPLIVLLGVNLTGFMLFLLVILSLEFCLIFALSLSLSALNLKYRDFYQMWDIALQLGFFISPIFYDPSIVPAKYQFVYFLNPVARLIDSTRDIFLFNRFPTFSDIGVILYAIAIFLLMGFLIFRHYEPRFAEEI
jgi:lipopolysaccharide transport system permease protein